MEELDGWRVGEGWVGNPRETLGKPTTGLVDGFSLGVGVGVGDGWNWGGAPLG